jgi:zinc/manganese transport system permease protein
MHFTPTFGCNRFSEFVFMRRALLGGLVLACSTAPLGVFLTRRMSLIGDAVAHGILPGAALGFWFAGLSLPALTIGGLGAGLSMAGLAAWITRRTGLREDASLAAIYPISRRRRADPGSPASAWTCCTCCSARPWPSTKPPSPACSGSPALSLIAMAVIYKPLLLDTLDPLFLQTVSRLGPLAHGVFLTLVVLNLVIGFQAIGALMVVGLMMLPAIASRFWSRRLPVPDCHLGGAGMPVGVAWFVAVVLLLAAQRPGDRAGGWRRVPAVRGVRTGSRLAAPPALLTSQ